MKKGWVHVVYEVSFTRLAWSNGILLEWHASARPKTHACTLSTNHLSCASREYWPVSSDSSGCSGFESPLDKVPSNAIFCEAGSLGWYQSPRMSTLWSADKLGNLQYERKYSISQTRHAQMHQSSTAINQDNKDTMETMNTPLARQNTSDVLSTKAWMWCNVYKSVNVNCNWVTDSQTCWVR